LKVSTAAVASWESGARKAKPKTLARFETILAGDAHAVGGETNISTMRLTITQAKEALARNYDASPDNIDSSSRANAPPWASVDRTTFFRETTQPD